MIIDMKVYQLIHHMMEYIHYQVLYQIMDKLLKNFKKKDFIIKDKDFQNLII